MARVRLIATMVLAGLLIAAALPAAAGAQCTGQTESDGVPQKPGPPVSWGINPAGRAGAAGPSVPLKPISWPKTFQALHQLRPANAPYTVRLNRFFWSRGADGVRHFVELTRRYASHGYRVELQLRYHPRPEQEGRIGRWANFVRHVVRRFGRIDAVRAIQVTNEVNFYPIAPDASDSAYDRARDALVRGVIAAHRVVRNHGFPQLKVGFNWAYHTDPANEESFWQYLRDQGGPRFVRSVDWVGLDAYPGTVFPPVESGDGYRDAMVNAFSVLRDCFLPIPGIPDRVPIYVEENGYPTERGVRPSSEQVKAMRQMVGATHDFRGTYNVTDYRWFDLRDHNTDSENFQHHYGLLRDGYGRKRAFDTYRRLVERFAG